MFNSFVVRFHLFSFILSINKLLLEVDKLPLRLNILCTFEILKRAYRVISEQAILLKEFIDDFFQVYDSF